VAKFYLKKGFTLGVLTIIVISLSVILLIALIPQIYDFLWGDKEVQAYLSQEVSLRTNSSIVAHQILKFTDQKNGRITWFYDKNSTLIGLGWVIYNVNGSYRLFIRGGQESWILHTGQGNCGEVAWFFSKMMNRLGYSANPILLYDRNGAGHMIAEYTNEQNNRVFVDPFAGSEIPDIFEYSKPWVYAETIDSDNQAHETTKTVIGNTSKLTFMIDDDYLKPLLSIRVRQVGSPIVSKSFSENNLQEVYLKNQNFTLEEELNFIAFKFIKTDEIALQENIIIPIKTEDILEIKNFKPTLVLLIIVCAIFITLTIHILKKYYPRLGFPP
jgi:hypothetical protein